ncbi:rhodanese-like domain-containing protein [Aquabacterium sp.]|jgi:rhodanese-related sulfurtransferase|uniref:rhodanese-like domain-containing protein n=1 Tax=Aquabacterium sp. TaxID=1872578 RepID=UPI0025BF47DC|nr:rhodanese-like domain-containing protein [Aquabacterium sp.]
MKRTSLILALSLAFSGIAAHAQQAASAATPAASTASAPAYVAPPWTYKTKQLNRNEVDKLLGNPKKLLIIDLRRPDELVKYGSFATYLNLQLKDLPELLEYIPKDRVILTVSNRAHRAGAAGDILTAAGYKVAGATGSEDYREAGGTIVKVSPPAPAASAASK